MIHRYTYKSNTHTYKIHLKKSWIALLGRLHGMVSSSEFLGWSEQPRVYFSKLVSVWSRRGKGKGIADGASIAGLLTAGSAGLLAFFLKLA